MEMPVYKTRRKIGAFEIDDLFCFVIAETDDAAIIHGYIRAVDFAAQNIDQFRVFEDQFGGPFAAGNAELLL
jgi:hypothetical protein